MQQATDDALIGDWLVKQSVSGWGPFKNWKKRYVVLCPDRIEWRTGQEDDAELLVKGSLPLFQTTTVTLQPSGDLVIASAGRELVLRGDDENRVQAWEHAVLFVASHQQQEQEERSAAPNATGDDGPRCVECEPKQQPRPASCNICLCGPAELAGGEGDEGGGGEGDAVGGLISLRRCRHAFCARCLHQHCQTQRRAGRAGWCPVCRRPLDVRGSSPPPTNPSAFSTAPPPPAAPPPSPGARGARARPRGTGQPWPGGGRGRGSGASQRAAARPASTPGTSACPTSP